MQNRSNPYHFQRRKQSIHQHQHLSMAMPMMIGLPAMPHRTPRHRALVRRRRIPISIHLLIVTLSTTRGASQVLIYLKRPHTPVCLLESRGIILYEVDTRCGITGTTRRTPNRARPVSTEGNIEHDLQIVEMRVDVAATGKECCGRAPARRVWSSR